MPAYITYHYNRKSRPRRRYLAFRAASLG